MKLFDFLLKEEEKEEKIIQTITQKITQNNYKIVECDGEKYIRFIESEIAKNGWSFHKCIAIPLNSVLEHSNDKIVYKKIIDVNNMDNKLHGEYHFGSREYYFGSYEKSIYFKKDLEESKSIVKMTCIYDSNNKYYNKVKQETIEKNIDLKISSPYECFCELDHKFLMIENDDEFNDYINSTLSYEDWARKKLVEKMLELGLGNGFINSFADLIDDVDKYHQMIDLATEVESKDILMYLFINKFKK